MGKVFISYSHNDEKWKDRVLKHLGVLVKENRLTVWDDRQIAAGQDCSVPAGSGITLISI